MRLKKILVMLLLHQPNHRFFSLSQLPTVEQWININSNGGEQTFLFPISFRSCLAVLGERFNAGDNTADLSATNLSSTGITINPNGSGKYYCVAMGI